MNSTTRIFYRGVAILADAASFKALGGPYSSDGRHVYLRAAPLVDADATSFVFLAGSDRPFGAAYGRDARSVFFGESRIDGADAPTFVVVDPAAGLSRDAARVYQRTEPLPVQPANVERFRVLAGPYATDGDLVYLSRPGLQVISTQVSRFRVLDEHYAVNGDELLFEGEGVEGFDVKHARLLAPGLVTDGSYLYAGASRLDDIDAATFQVLTPPTGALSSYFARDRDRVFWFIQSEPNAIETERVGEFVALDGRYAHDGYTVFYCSRPVEGADASSLESLGHDFAKDAEQVFHEGSTVDGHAASFRHVAHHDGVTFLADLAHVYREERQFSDHTDWSSYEMLPGADPASFTAFSAAFSRDAKTVFLNGAPLPGVDTARFRPLGEGAFTDGQRIWFHKELHGVMPSTFALVGGGYARVEVQDLGALRCLGHGYAANDVLVYFHGSVVAGADPASFQSLGHGFARDGKRAYSYVLATESLKMPSYEPCGGVLPDADAASFRVIGRFHATDGRRVFWRSLELEGLSGADVRVLSDMYATDGTRLFCQGQLMTDVDVASFEVLPGDYVDRYSHTIGQPHGGYGRDRLRLFLGASSFQKPQRYFSDEQRQRLNALSSARLRALDAYFGTDGSQVLCFRDCHVLAADAHSFEPLGHGFARDAHRVYYGSHPLRDADVRTFEVLSEGYARDAQRVFYSGQALADVAPSAFRTLGGGCATDGESVYRGMNRLDGADVETFEVLARHGLARDATHVWSLSYGFAPFTLGGNGALEVLGEGYLRVNGVLRWRDQELEAERATFEVLQDGYARDAHHGFFQGQVLGST
ncbi:DKNYY domain-containing protein [Pyxidicoccus caerfyrddinensis]|uniref:DKNYY domain-containing protein n=1 Tax=Pyxidicoccus caerfyrddinensis TaxID=2709663 RepID=UPI0013DAC904|nr:DKNYY domain-containing protein [Pyxidicoccus caerfyrddinensis]